MAKSTGCKRAPLINGEPSQLYLDLFQMLTKTYHMEPILARDLTNVLYINYIRNDSIKTSLDNSNKARNSQKQHSAQDVFDILHGDELVKYSSIEQLVDLSISEGSMLDRATTAEFDNWEDAYNIATRINANHRYSISSYVIKAKDKYEVKVKQLNASNELNRLNTQIEYEEMQLIKKAFTAVGLDINAFNDVQGTYFGKNYEALIRWLRAVHTTNPRNLLTEDFKRLILLQKDVPIVERLINKMGGVESLAAAYFNWYRGNYTPSQATQTQLDAGIQAMQSLKGLDVNNLAQSSKDLKKNLIDNSEEKLAAETFDLLNDKYKIGLVNVKINLNNLNSISKNLEAAIKVLGQRLKKIKEEQGKSGNYFTILNKISKLQTILDQKENSLGTVQFLGEVLNHTKEMLDYFKTPIPADTDLSYWLSRGDQIREAEDMIGMYLPIVFNLSNIDTLKADISISDEDSKLIVENTRDVTKTINSLNQAVQESKQQWLRTTMSLIMPEKSPMTVDEVLATLNTDATIFDRIYDIATISHAPTAIVGAFIQKTSDDRVKELIKYQQRISANSEKVNHDTSYMYEMIDGKWYIASDIDWSAHNEARKKAYISFKRRKLTGYELEVAMDAWEKGNTEEIEVYAEYDDQGNKINNRTERVPLIKKEHPSVTDKWSQEQIEVYNEFMKIKGELETKFPYYAQNYYRPPQLRKSAADKLFEGSIGGFAKEKFQQKYSLREDSQGYGQMPFEDTESVRTDITGTSTNVIPIWYVHPLKEQSDLYRNMGAGLLHLASTAINYESMSRIRDSVELFDQLINSKRVSKSGGELSSTYTYGNITYSTPVIDKNRTSAKILNTYKRRILYNNDFDNDAIGLRMLANTVSEATSIAALTFNVFGAINNRLEGIQQGLTEALVHKSNTMDLGDFMWAWSVMWGNKILSVLPGDAQSEDGKYACGSFWKDLFSGRPSTLYGLIIQRLNPKKDSFDEILKTQFRSNAFRRAIANTDLKFIMYSMGEELNNIPLVLGMTRHKRVLYKGKEVNLTSVLKRDKNADGTYSLGIKEGATDLDGTPIDEAYLDRLSASIGTVSQELNGGMSKPVQGQIASTIAGAAVLKLRQWMVGTGARTFRGSYIDWRTGKAKKGSIYGTYSLTVKPMVDAIKQVREASKGTPWGQGAKSGIAEFTKQAILNYRNMDDASKVATARFFQQAIFMTLLGLLVDAMLIYGFKDNKDDEDFKILFYFIKRRYKDSQFFGALDIRHIARWGETATTLVDLTQKPYAYANIVGDLLYPVTNMEDYGKLIERGVNKDSDRYLTNWSRKWAPPLKLYDRIRGIKDTNDLLNSLGGSFRGYSMEKEYEKLVGSDADQKYESLASMRAKAKREMKKMQEEE